MARCGRCGLWYWYPEDHDEEKYVGACLWYQHRLAQDEVYERRECGEFFEMLPGWTPQEQFEYKVKRMDLGKAHREARHGKRVAYVGVILSVLALGWGVVEFLLS